MLAKGKSIIEIDTKDADRFEVLKTALGRSGSLRAPTIKLGDIGSSVSTKRYTQLSFNYNTGGALSQLLIEWLKLISGIINYYRHPEASTEGSEPVSYLT